MLNTMQIHLALNHLPIVGTLIGLLVTLSGFILRNLTVRRTGLGILFVIAGLTIPTFLSGEPAEDALMKLGVPHGIIHEHEEAAEPAFAVTLVTGALAALALLLPRLRKPALESKATIAAAMAAVVTMGLLGRAAHLGGLIRHEELRPASGLPTSSLTESAEPNADHHDHRD